MSLCGKVNQIHLCKYARLVHANGGWSFYGCTHEPYHGKWIAEIEECPLGKTPEEEERLMKENKQLEGLAL